MRRYRYSSCTRCGGRRIEETGETVAHTVQYIETKYRNFKSKYDLGTKHGEVQKLYYGFGTSVNTSAAEPSGHYGD